MRKPLVVTLFALAIASSAGFVGCTSILGDFTVSDTSTSPTPDSGGGSETGADGATCTVCPTNACADLASDNANCGACGTACNGGQTCQASACKCPADKAFCANQCVAESRAACGATCAACLADEVCREGCTAAPGPAFESTPRDPTGWTDSAGAPIVIKLKPTGIPGTLYECRTGPEASFTPSDPPWKPCDGAAGTNPTHSPTASATTAEGSYRTEYRYRSDTFRSNTIALQYYVHNALNKVATCPRPGQAGDGPHLTDADYFQAAQAFAAASGGTYTIADTFPVPGNARTDPFWIRNPFIKIPFSGVQAVAYMNTWPAPGTAFDHTVNERSLRHKFVLNPTRTLLLVKRQYVHPKGHCRNGFRFGSQMAKWRGPTGRGPRELDCEALVLNVHGFGVCLGTDAAGKAAPLAVDHRPFDPPNFGYAPNPATATVTGAAGGTTLTASAGAYVAFLPGRWIWVESAKRWYQVTAVAGQVLTLSEALPWVVTGSTWKYSSTTTTLKDVFVIPTGFAHLYADGKNWATAPRSKGNFNPSFGTKCETVGCATGKPWLTYLPP